MIEMSADGHIDLFVINQYYYKINTSSEIMEGDDFNFKFNLLLSD